MTRHCLPLANIVFNIVYTLRDLSSNYVELCLLQPCCSLAVCNPGVSSSCQHFPSGLLSNMLFIDVLCNSYYNRSMTVHKVSVLTYL